MSLVCRCYTDCRRFHRILKVNRRQQTTDILGEKIPPEYRKRKMINDRNVPNDDAAHLVLRLAGNDFDCEIGSQNLLSSRQVIASSSNYSVEWFRPRETTALYSCILFFFNRYTYFARLSSRIEKFREVRASNRGIRFERKLRGFVYPQIPLFNISIVWWISCWRRRTFLAMHGDRCRRVYDVRA